MKTAISIFTLLALAAIPRFALANDNCMDGAAAFLASQHLENGTARKANAEIDASNRYVACGIRKKAAGDTEGAAAVGLQGARAAAAAAYDLRAAWGMSTLEGSTDDSLADQGKQSLRNAIHLAEDVARMHSSYKKEAAAMAYEFRSQM